MNLTEHIRDERASRSNSIDFTDPVVRQKAIEGRKGAVPIGTSIDICTSPKCSLYPVRFGKPRRGLVKGDK